MYLQNRIQSRHHRQDHPTTRSWQGPPALWGDGTPAEIKISIQSRPQYWPASSTDFYPIVNVTDKLSIEHFLSQASQASPAAWRKI